MVQNWKNSNARLRDTNKRFKTVHVYSGSAQSQGAGIGQQWAGMRTRSNQLGWHNRQGSEMTRELVIPGKGRQRMNE